MNAFLKQALKQFLPTIEQKAVPSVEELLGGVIKEVTLQDDEDSAAIVLQPYTTGEWWAYVVTFSEDNRICRVVRQMRMKEIIEMALKQIDKI